MARQIWTKLGWNVPWEVLTEFDSIKNSGCHGNKMEFSKQFFENLLLWNRWSNFEMISQECALGDPSQKNVREILIGPFSWLW